jgi:hypothetical protein
MLDHEPVLTSLTIFGLEINSELPIGVARLAFMVRIGALLYDKLTHGILLFSASPLHL